jgi:hypothetical protein
MKSALLKYFINRLAIYLFFLVNPSCSVESHFQQHLGSTRIKESPGVGANMLNLPSWLQTLPGLTVTLDHNPGNDLLSRLIQNWSVANSQSRQGALVSHHASLYPTRKILDLTLNQNIKSSSLGSLPSQLLDQIIAGLIRHVISSRAALLKFSHQIGCRISNG